MALRRTSIEEHDVVRLAQSVDGWPAGTKGTVVSELHRGAMLVEFGDEADSVLDRLAWVPVDLLDVTHPQGRPAGA